jgi:hypothetical protein
MATLEDLDGVIERCQQAMREFGKGDPQHMQALCSHGEDVVINTAIDPLVLGPCSGEMRTIKATIGKRVAAALRSVLRRDVTICAFYNGWICTS